MINTDRIVSVSETDLLSLYSTILEIGNVSATKLNADDVLGNFTQSTNNATVICTQPVKSFNFTAAATAGTVYFVPGTDFEGFMLAKSPATTAGDTVNPDGHSLYSATLSGGTVTFAQIGF